MIMTKMMLMTILTVITIVVLVGMIMLLVMMIIITTTTTILYTMIDLTRVSFENCDGNMLNCLSHDGISL